MTLQLLGGGAVTQFLSLRRRGWAVAFGKLGPFGFWSMMLFLAVLTVGFIYEWKKGALEWN